MKKIFLLIIIIFLIYLSSCSSNKITITIDDIPELETIIDYEKTNIINKNNYFQFPVIESKDYYNHEYQEEDGYLIYTKTKYSIVFEGWIDLSTNKLITDSTIKVKKDTTFTPKYICVESQNTITLYNEYFKIDKIYSENDVLTLPNLTTEDYSSYEWYSNDKYIGTPKTDIILNQNENYTFYAKVVPTYQYVCRLISEINEELTFEDIEIVQNVKKIYMNLGYTEREKVTNYNILELAEKKLPDLITSYDLYLQIEELLTKQISAKLINETNKIVEQYNLLTENQKIYISNWENAVSFIDEVNSLYELYGIAAIEFDKRIAQIPLYVEYNYESEITQLYDEYQMLEEDVIGLLKIESKLLLLKERLDALKNDASKITFVLKTDKTKNIYTSKKELFTAFFSDFYYYIIAYHTDEVLIYNKINTVDDFVKLAGDFNGAGVSNLYGIGNLAGNYMLEKDINGILSNQTEKGFFGFCYKNNLYQDLLPFFINFFAFWRIDEKYANINNYGADIFAEGWAPTVDIAKFFYYNEETSYVKTDRMIDCLTNISSVAYGIVDSKTLPTEIKLRGYKFEGWYDNPNFSGNPVTSVSTTNEKIYLYAKFSVDNDQMDADNAALVDVYIYNLTTKQAIVNATTVGYVKDMYDNLSMKGKQLVKSYNTLEQLIDKYNNE